MAKITILGAGGFGTALAVMTQKYGHEVTLWSFFEEELKRIEADGEHAKLLPGVPVSPMIRLTTSLHAVQGADIVILAVPSHVARKICVLLKDILPTGMPFVNVAKGFEEETMLRISQIALQELSEIRFVSLSGPSHAEEVARGVPTTVVAASESEEAARYVQTLLMNDRFRIYVSTDVVGVELGGGLKNVIALAAGMIDGLKLGDNAKAALMTRGIAEISRLGVALGGQKETFSGLSGIGDLIVTCTSMHSRNRRAGIMIGEGLTPEEAIERVGMTVEGYRATRSAYYLAQRAGVEMPIAEQLYQVLYENKPATAGVDALMRRSGKNESI